MAFVLKDHHLYLDQDGQSVDLSDWVKGREKAHYLYDLDGMKQRMDLWKSSFQSPVSIHYALKANAHPLVLSLVAQQGFGVDVVSGGEMQLALDHGIAAEKIVFSGVGKTSEELESALRLQIKQINVESPEELERIAQISKKLKVTARVAFRLNPDVNPSTHPYITTGFRENKFGMDVSFFPTLRDQLKKYSDLLELWGLTMHIGSQIRDLDTMKEALNRLRSVFMDWRSDFPEIKTIDVGGGLGIDYEKPEGPEEKSLIQAYAQMVEEVLKGTGAEILCEPGRILVARFGVLLTQVNYIKRTPHKNFAIVNTGMHHLIRPALYQAFHRIVPLASPSDSFTELYDVVGPICESSDVLGHDRWLPQLQSGDWLAIMDTGAYGAVMASQYNAHGLPGEYGFSQGICIETQS